MTTENPHCQVERGIFERFMFHCYLGLLFSGAIDSTGKYVSGNHKPSDGLIYENAVTSEEEGAPNLGR